MLTPMMTPVAPVHVSSDRSNFVFSENGNYAVCLRTCDAELTLESWTLTAEQPQCQTVRDVTVDRDVRACPFDDGRILLFHAAGRSTAPRSELALLQPVAGGFTQRSLGTIPTPRVGHLLPSPNSDHLGFVVTLDDLNHSTIWRLPDSTAQAEPIMQVPGSLTGGVWLDGAALVLGINQTCGGAPTSGIAVDLAQESWKRIWSVSDTSSDQILCYNPRSKLIIVSSTVSDRQRLGWARLGDSTVYFPDTLHRPGYVRDALTLDDQGERLLVSEVTGATSRLFVYTPVDDRLEVLAGPPGRISSSASWVGDIIRFRFSIPCHTPTLATVRLEPEPRWSWSSGHKSDLQGGEPQAELITLEGPAGPIEAIVYGGPDWRTSEHLVVALHGGPLSSWRFEFEPLFHCLAVNGVAVVAPNYRGSTGYGEEYLRSVIGNWGGPDLDDVLDLARSLKEDRKLHQLSDPVVLGVSYGAFLALLAACHEPQLWSACVALAPFLSGVHFHDSANDAVRARIEQLGGLRQIEDDSGPRDVLRVCAALSAPLLLMHGIEDDTIPVEQSRMLRRRLLELGRTEDVDFDYVEVDTNHDGLIRTQPDNLNQRVAHFCRTRKIKPLPTVMGSGVSKSITQNRRRLSWEALTW